MEETVRPMTVPTRAYATAAHRISKCRDYDSLVRCYPPRVIRSTAGLAKVHEVIEALMAVEKLNGEQLEYLELLSTLAENYEGRRFPTPRQGAGALLAHLLETRSVSQSDVSRSTGVAASTICDVIAGRRALSRRNIVRLANYFGVDPAIFLSVDE